MTDNMMPELTLEPTAAAEAVPQLTLEPPAPEVPEPEEKKIEPVEMDEKLLTDEEKKAMKEAEEEKKVDKAEKPEEKKEEKKAQEIVFIVYNGVVKSAPVKRGISDDQWIEITEGLKDSVQVVSGSYKAINRELEDGSKVRVEEQRKEIRKKPAEGQ